MTNTTVFELGNFLKKEIGPFYPKEETDAMIYRIFQHVLNFSRADIYLKQDTKLPKSVLQQVEKITGGLKKFVPLQYLLGETCFYGLTFLVNPHVLIPRPETEELVEWVLKEQDQHTLDVVDFGTGSGCIAITIASERPGWNITAVDISKDALSVAMENASRNHATIHFCEDSLLDLSTTLLDMKFDLIVSNPPYVTGEQKTVMQPNVLDYEPHIALFAPGTDPLIFYRKIARFAASNLRKSGKMFLEINEALPFETAGVFESQGFSTELRKDIHGKYRMLKVF
ncbi:MAG: peptide chain release factor N(5)-glutamine methyltransferase [Bacteroidales bacterium]|nr:peptide chain release factor N(5)-glutamine methyltransferase [Bacteroidales bacterium]